MPPLPSSVKISYSPAVAVWRRAPTTDHGDTSVDVVETVGADGSTRWFSGGVKSEPDWVISVPQTPQKRSPFETAPPQLGQIDVVVGVIESSAALTRVALPARRLDPLSLQSSVVVPES